MSDAERERRIRERAHQIWEQEGKPEGVHEHHWQRAREEIDAEEGATSLERTVTETIGLAVGEDPNNQPATERKAKKPAARPRTPRPKKP
ncbi:DUF2934 domain-containing protein [Mesorhizobium sp. CAU 1741]|uniref:DUF2934 domain-containing protein n=1 Tax=Mesorhizobium sp. CAU 1741 TaxID=3140366 RepID=UPI00325B9FE0